MTTLRTVDRRTIRHRPINPRIARFIMAYLEHGNGSLAAKQAGYSDKCLNRCAYLLLRTKRVKEAIDRLSIASITKGYVLKAYKQVAEDVYRQDATALDKRVAIEALKGITLIQGYNAPTTTHNLNVNANISELRSVNTSYESDS